jgi:hypothetical protein
MKVLIAFLLALQATMMAYSAPVLNEGLPSPAFPRLQLLTLKSLAVAQTLVVSI